MTDKDSNKKLHHNATDWAWNPTPEVHKAVERGKRKYAAYKKAQMQKPLDEITQEITAMRNQETQSNAPTEKSTPTRLSSLRKKSVKKTATRTAASKKKVAKKAPAKKAPAKKVRSSKSTTNPPVQNPTGSIPLKKIIPENMTPQEARRRLRHSKFSDLRVDGRWKFSEENSKAIIEFLTKDPANDSSSS